MNIVNPKDRALFVEQRDLYISSLLEPTNLSQKVNTLLSMFEYCLKHSDIALEVATYTLPRHSYTQFHLLVSELIYNSAYIDELTAENPNMPLIRGVEDSFHDLDRAGVFNGLTSTYQRHVLMGVISALFSHNDRVLQYGQFCKEDVKVVVAEPVKAIKQSTESTLKDINEVMKCVKTIIDALKTKNDMDKIVENLIIMMDSARKLDVSAIVAMENRLATDLMLSRGCKHNLYQEVALQK